MATTLIRYELDPTGVNPDNKVVGEIHDLSDRDIRAVTPTYGPFFTESLQVIDESTGIILQRGNHYQCVELLQDATLKYGKEICSVVLILDPLVSPRVSVTYQVVGGYFTNDSTAIANLYETVINDNRPVQWENVLNKPLEYPPTLHRHLMDDLYGFEAIVAALERIRNAILLTDVPAFETIINWVNSRIERISNTELRKSIPNRKIVDYHSLLVVLTKFRVLSTYRFEYVPDFVREGVSYIVTVSGLDVPQMVTLYWEVIHETTDDTDVIPIHGTVTLVNGYGGFQLYINPDEVSEIPEYFCIGLKPYKEYDDYIAISYTMRISNFIPIEQDITAEDHYIVYDTMMLSDKNLYAKTLFLNESNNRGCMIHRGKPYFDITGHDYFRLYDTPYTSEMQLTAESVYLDTIEPTSGYPSNRFVNF